MTDKVNDGAVGEPSVVPASNRGSRGDSPMRKPCRALWLLPLALAACTPEPKVMQDLPQPVGRADRRHSARISRPTSPRPMPRPRVTAPYESGWIPARGISSRWECIVIHHSAGEVGGAKRFDKIHRAPPRNWNELGYHFVIGNGSDTNDGCIEVGPRWLKQKHGAHCKTPDGYYNQHGIGIGLVGNFENHPPSRAQMRSLAKLVRFLQEKCCISTGRIVTHGGVTGKTLCPGRYFNLAQLRAMLASPTYASDY